MINSSNHPESVLNGSAIACHSRGNPWHGRGTTRAMGRATAISTLKNRVSQVAASDRLAKRKFCQSNQRIALIAASLRYVWTFYEDQRAEHSFDGPIFKGDRGLMPANEKALSASLTLRTSELRTAYLALLVALLPPTAILADDWSSSGSFDLEEAAQIRKSLVENPASDHSPWRSTAKANQWVALDEFERSRPGKRPPAPSTFQLPSGSIVDQLFALIAFAEAPKGRYDSIHHGAKIRPAKKPSQMTLAEIYQWIDDTPGQPHAIGNFQIIPSTLLNLQKRLGLPDGVLFNRATQNRMAALLLADAGHHKFGSGKISLATYQNNLARIWAGLPLASGKSAYHGYAGNRATITRAFYDQKMQLIFGGGESRVAKATSDVSSAPVTGTWNTLGE